MSELKACPFCGSLASVHLEGQGYHVRCNYGRNCGAIGPYKMLRAEAVTAWNTRFPEEPEDNAVMQGDLTPKDGWRSGDVSQP